MNVLKDVKKKLEWRLDFVRRSADLCWRDRVSHIGPGSNRHRESLIDRMVSQTADGEKFFRLRDLKIFFLPEGGSEESHYASARTVMIESYLCSDDFYSEHVQIRPGDIVLDAGAYIGTCAINFARRTGNSGKVYAFEPLMHSLVTRNLNENGISNVEVVATAVGDRCGEVEFMVGESVTSSSMARKPGKVTHKLKCPVTTLDAFARERSLPRVDFIKLDIEGAEELAIRGAEQIIKAYHPVWSISSYHTDHEGDAQHPKLIRILADDYGYNVEEQYDRGKPVRLLAW